MVFARREMMAEPPAPETLLMWAKSLPGGIWDLVHPERQYEGQPALEAFRGWEVERVAAALTADPGILRKPLLTDGQAVIPGFEEVEYVAFLESYAEER